MCKAGAELTPSVLRAAPVSQWCSGYAGLVLGSLDILLINQLICGHTELVPDGLSVLAYDLESTLGAWAT